MSGELLMLPYTTLQDIGWTLIHFLWQGLLLAALLNLVLPMCRGPVARHNCALATSVMIALTPIITFLFIHGRGSDALWPVALNADAPEISAAVTAYLPGVEILVFLWLLGIVILSMRALGAVCMAENLRRRDVSALPPDLLRRCRALQARLALSFPVQFLASMRVTAPVVVGWLRPVVLIPLSAITGLPAQQLDAIILHELAHIRRFDAFTNILLLAIETILFYHPAVWWVSRRVRIEREYCCDDFAVSMCGDVTAYAEALTSLESWRAAPVLALGAGGGGLKKRVVRLLGAPYASRGSSLAVAANVSLLAVLGLAGCVAALSAQDPNDSPPIFISDYVPTAEDYDPIAVRERVTGEVILSVLVGLDGSCKEARIVESDSPLLDQSAIRLCQERLKWEPAQRNDRPVEAWTMRRVRFELSSEPPAE